MIAYYKELENDKIDTLSRRTNYFKENKQVKHLILKTNQDSMLSYNHIVLAATFRAKNSTFAERLQVAIQYNKITQAILKKMS